MTIKIITLCNADDVTKRMTIKRKDAVPRFGQQRAVEERCSCNTTHQQC